MSTTVIQPAVTYQSLLVCDPDDCERLIKARQEVGHDRYDEVWDGVYVMSPLADIEHMYLVGQFTVIFTLVTQPGKDLVLPGCNVSDRDTGWESNYRVPDVAVYLKDNPAINRISHWQGGPDFAVEIVSRGDQSRQKFDFYAKVGTRELLILDRSPWCLELYHLENNKLELKGRSTVEEPVVLVSGVLPLSFRLGVGTERPTVEVRRTTGSGMWSL